jgi:hypothetical protein
LRFNPEMSRNPLWTDDEVVLVLSLYFEHGPLPASDEKVIELSRVMSALPVNVRGEHWGTVRKPGAIAMKLANFANAENPGEGLSSVGPRDRRFFDAYSDRRDDCRERARAIHRAAARDVAGTTARGDSAG